MNLSDLFRDWNECVEFSQDEVIFTQGDPADFMYVILAGEMELSLHGEVLGKETVGGVFGEVAIIQSADHSTTAKSVSDVKLARISRPQFKKLITGNPEFSLHVMSVLANRLRAVDKYISAQFSKQK